MRAVRLWVRARAPLSRSCVSRTTLGAGSAYRLGDDGADRFVPEGAGALTGPFDDGVQLLVGQGFERAVDLFEARARCQQERQDALRQFLTLGLGQGLD